MTTSSRYTQKIHENFDGGRSVFVGIDDFIRIKVQINVWVYFYCFFLKPRMSQQHTRRRALNKKVFGLISLPQLAIIPMKMKLWDFICLTQIYMGVFTHRTNLKYFDFVWYSRLGLNSSTFCFVEAALQLSQSAHASMLIILRHKLRQ